MLQKEVGMQNRTVKWELMHQQSIPYFVLNFLPTTFLPVSLANFLHLGVNRPLEREVCANR